MQNVIVVTILLRGDPSALYEVIKHCNLGRSQDPSQHSIHNVCICAYC